MKKEWKAPEMKELDVKMTENGWGDLWQEGSSYVVFGKEYTHRTGSKS